MKKRVVSLTCSHGTDRGTCWQDADLLPTAALIRRTAAADEGAEAEDTADSAEATTRWQTVKAGFIFLHDENSTYDLNFMNAAKEACEKLGVEYMTKTNIPEGQECYEAACELADAGCNFIFADSFGHEDYMIEAAKEYPGSTVQPRNRNQEHIQRIWTTSTMHSLPSMMDVTWQVSLQV